MNPQQNPQSVPVQPQQPPSHADKRPRIQTRVTTANGEIELDIQGAEGERSTDLVKTLDACLERMRHLNDELSSEQESPGVQ